MAVSCGYRYKLFTVGSNYADFGEVSWIRQIHHHVQVRLDALFQGSSLFFYSRSVCFKMGKFFFCYIWLAIGFLVAFKIFFPENRVFKWETLPIPLITMMVMMLGELNYRAKLFPESTFINLTKKEDGVQDKYIGVSESKEDYLQFPGEYSYDF